MNNSTKAISLVAVLALCCAALAGSAYAYSATYIDTIGSQDIEDVYLLVGSSKNESYSGYDLDMEYNTYRVSNGSNYYDLECATITDGTAEKFVTMDEDSNTARFCILIDTLSIAAKGDDATVSTVTATVNNGAAEDPKDVIIATNGASAFLYLSKTPLASIDDVEDDQAGILDFSENIVVGTPKNVYVYIVIDVSQLQNSDAVEGYYLPLTGINMESPILVNGFNVKFVANAGQTPVTP